MNDYLRLWKHMAWESGHVDRAVAQQWNILQKLDLQQQILMTGHLEGEITVNFCKV